MRTVIQMVCALLLVACGGDDPEGGGAAAIELSPRNLLLVGAGDSWQLDAVVYDGEGDVLDVPVTWEADDPTVVTIDPTGRVTSHSPVGSSAVRAVVGDVRSEDGFVYPAILQPGTRVLADSEIVSGPDAVGDVTYSPGDRFTVTVSDGGGASAGDPIVAREEAPVLGRITAVTGNVIEYELAPMTAVYDELDVEVRQSRSRGHVRRRRRDRAFADPWRRGARARGRLRGSSGGERVGDDHAARSPRGVGEV